MDSSQFDNAAARSWCLVTLVTTTALVCFGCSSVESLSTSLQRGATGMGGDETPRMASSAQHWSIGEQKPVWRTDIGHLEVDILTPIPGHGVLVGMTSIGSSGEPGYGPLVLFDESTGREYWRYKRDADYQYLYDVLESDPVLLITRNYTGVTSASQYIALEPTTGAAIWTKEFVGERTRLVVSGLLVQASAYDGSVVVEAIRLADGITAWSSELEGTERLPALHLWGEDILVAGDGATALSVADGSRVWRSPSAGPLGDLSNLLLLDESAIIPASDGRVVRMARDGDIMWETRLPIRPGIVQADDAHVVIQAVGSSGQMLHALALETGEYLWHHDIEGHLNSGIVAHPDGSFIYVAHRDQRREAIVLDSVTGSRQCMQRVGPVLVGATAADRLFAFDNRFVIVGETWLGAVSVPDCTLLWSRQIDADVTTARALGRMRDALTSTTLVPNGDERQRIGDEFDTIVEAHRQRDLVRAARAAEYEVRGIVSQVRFQRQRWSENQIDAYATPAGARALMATNNALAAMRMGREQAVPLSEMARFPMEMAAARRMHERSVSRNLFVRGNLRRGLSTGRWGVRIVDIESGEWTEIVTSPYEGAYTDVGIFTSSGLLSAVLTENDRIVVKGLGLDPRVWTKMKIGVYEVVEPALLAYELDRSRFKDADMELVVGGAGVIDTTGTYVIPPIYKYVETVSDGLATVVLDVEAGPSKTVVDLRGRQLFEPTTMGTGKFSEGLAPLDGESVGFINKLGQFVIDPIFRRNNDYFHPEAGERYIFHAGRAVVRARDGWTIIDRDGDPLVDPGRYDTIWSFSEGRAAIEVGGQWGFVDESGYPVIAPRFDQVGHFSEGWAAVVSGGRRMYIDYSGSVVLDLGEKFADSGPRRNNRIRVVRDGMHGYIDLRGAMVVPVTYGDADDFSEGLAAVSQNQRWGYINESGNLVVDFQFFEARPFSQGLASVGIETGHERYIRADGSFAFDGNWYEALPFNDEGFASVTLMGGERHWVRVTRSSE